ncbi:MAG: hypothetical protein GY938_27190 [Ketobacter sp.]|nr:hypothetical protein [Ketobacter sp.]
MNLYIATYSMTKYTETLVEALKASNAQHAKDIIKRKGSKVVFYGEPLHKTKSYARPIPPLSW